MTGGAAHTNSLPFTRSQLGSARGHTVNNHNTPHCHLGATACPAYLSSRMPKLLIDFTAQYPAPCTFVTVTEAMGRVQIAPQETRRAEESKYLHYLNMQDSGLVGSSLSYNAKGFDAFIISTHKYKFIIPRTSHLYRLCFHTCVSKEAVLGGGDSHLLQVKHLPLSPWAFTSSYAKHVLLSSNSRTVCCRDTFFLHFSLTVTFMFICSVQL